MKNLRPHMSDPKGYYKVLGLEPGSDISKVKLAYGALISKHHPGYGEYMKKALKITDPAQQKKAIDEIKETAAKLNEAKQTLTDPDKKAEYDNQYEGRSIFDIFGYNNRVRKVKDTAYEITVTMEQAYLGVTKKFKIKRCILCVQCDGKGGDSLDTCDMCKGAGVTRRQIQSGVITRVYEQTCQKCRGECKIVSGKQCAGCKGKRYVNNSESLEVCVKPGVYSGEEILFEGMGDEREGLVTGDLRFTVVVDEGVYKRVGDHVIAPVNVDLYTALAGGTISFKHLDGQVYNISIKKIRKFDELIRVRRLGFNGKGDLYLKPEYDVPNVKVEKLQQVFKVPEVKKGEKLIGEHAEAPEIEETHHHEQSDAYNVFKNFFSF